MREHTNSASPVRPARLRPPGQGLLVAALLLAAVEFGLHTDGFLYQYRSVFAAGRALDKTLYVEGRRPELLIHGYSEMAIGLALLFGVALPRNFLYPYISRNPTEFWRRWHITLSLWLRDYLYIPLGGNRQGGLRTNFNLMATMVLGGLWHGANWTFVVWGALHGLYLIGHRLLISAFNKLGVLEGGRANRLLSLAGMPLTFTLVLITWVFFRAHGFTDAWTVLSAMVSLHGESGTPVSFRLFEIGIVAVAALLVALEPLLVSASERNGIGWWWRIPHWLRGMAYAGLVLTIVAFGGTTQKFIYFDF